MGTWQDTVILFDKNRIFVELKHQKWSFPPLEIDAFTVKFICNCSSIICSDIFSISILQVHLIFYFIAQVKIMNYVIVYNEARYKGWGQSKSWGGNLDIYMQVALWSTRSFLQCWPREELNWSPCPFQHSFLLTHWGRDKWTPFRRRHFQMHFLQWKCLNFD